MAWGTIKNLTTDRGFGYILPEGKAASATDLYFNRMDVRGQSVLTSYRPASAWNTISVRISRGGRPRRPTCGPARSDRS